jgi:hypothetical protein
VGGGGGGARGGRASGPERAGEGSQEQENMLKHRRRSPQALAPVNPSARGGALVGSGGDEEKGRVLDG